MKLKFRNTKTIIEHEYICVIDNNNYNSTLNPTSINNNNYLNSEFTPYITSIGLYNDNAELLVIAKLSHPIKKLKNINMNFIIKFNS